MRVYSASRRDCSARWRHPVIPVRWIAYHSGVAVDEVAADGLLAQECLDPPGVVGGLGHRRTDVGDDDGRTVSVPVQELTEVVVVAAELGIARATAQRYLAALAQDGVAEMTLRYGATGRAEHLYALIHRRR
jgi:hypothetical protein